MLGVGHLLSTINARWLIASADSCNPALLDSKGKTNVSTDKI